MYTNIKFNNIMLVIFLLSSFWSLAVAQIGSSNKYIQQREFNERCRSKKDCRPFGYVCRDNQTCQCDFMYVPDAQKRSCVGGVNQKCIYDEHCIEGAFCMNQAMCKCKDSSPIELEDGLICAGTDRQKPTQLSIILLLLIVGNYRATF